MKKRKLTSARFLEYIVSFLIIGSVNFFLPRIMPGDPFLDSEGDYESGLGYEMSQEQADYYKSYYGLDQPLFKQYYLYATGLCRGDFGFSYTYKTGVLGLILTRLPWTLCMVMAALFFSSLSGVSLGIFCAWKRGVIDQALSSIVVFFSELPSFITGLAFLFIFAVTLRLFPLAGATTPFQNSNTILANLADIIYHATLPLATLVFSKIGGFFILGRNSMVHVLSMDYIKTAYAKGLSRRRILFIHALKNALMPIITRLFMSMATFFSGAVLVENVFSYPGVGGLMGTAISNRDYPLLQGVLLIMAFCMLVMNILADFVYGKLDPRISE